MVTDVLDKSKSIPHHKMAESPTINPTHLEFDPQQEAEKLISIYEKNAKRIKIKFNLADTEHKIVSGDPVSLKRILQNLIVNAIKFSGDDKFITVQLAYKGKVVHAHTRLPSPGF